MNEMESIIKERKQRKRQPYTSQETTRFLVVLCGKRVMFMLSSISFNIQISLKFMYTLCIYHLLIHTTPYILYTSIFLYENLYFVTSLLQALLLSLFPCSLVSRVS